MSYDYDYDASISQGAQVGAPKREVRREQSTWMTDQDSEKMCTLFSDGLSAGIGYSRILDFMERQKLDAALIKRLRHAVLEDGNQLGEAFARFGVLDAPSRKLLLVAEEQGNAPQTFKEQARFFGNRYERRKKAVFAMVYPVIIVCLGVFFFASNIESAVRVASETNNAETAAELTSMGLRSIIKSFIFAVTYAFSGYMFLNMPVDSGLRSMAGRLWFALPIVSTAARMQSVANFTRYLQQSVNAGMDMYRSIDLAADASGHPGFIRSAPRAMDLLEQGYPLDAAFREIKGMPDEVLDYIGIGEETGRLDEQLRFLTERYDKLAEEAAERTMTYFTNFTVMVIVVGSLVTAFLTVIKMFGTMFDGAGF